MTNAEFQEQNELLQSEVAYYKELLTSIEEAAVNAYIADKHDLYKDFAEFTHKSISFVEIQVRKLHESEDTEPYERDLTTDNQQDS